MTISVIVPAAGCGARANLNGNKVLFPLHERPLLWWTLRALSHPEAFPTGTQLTEIIIAARADEFSRIEDVLSLLRGENKQQKPFQSTLMRCVEGGASRQESVYQAARVAQGDLLLVHDAARPLVSPALMARVIEAAQLSGAAIAALPVADTVKLAGESKPGSIPQIAQTLDRQRIWLAQTPQIFKREVLLSALEAAQEAHFVGTDCASLVERMQDETGQPRYAVTLVEGETSNIKVTYAADIERAEALLAHQVKVTDVN